jgi:hypothetical protein
VFGIWNRRDASHPGLYHDPQPQESPKFGEPTRYLVKKKAMLYVVASNGADGELRICIPISDVIDGQVDQGVKMLLDTGGEVAQRDLTFEMNR